MSATPADADDCFWLLWLHAYAGALTVCVASDLENSVPQAFHDHVKNDPYVQ